MVPIVAPNVDKMPKTEGDHFQIGKIDVVPNSYFGKSNIGSSAI